MKPSLNKNSSDNSLYSQSIFSVLKWASIGFFAAFIISFILSFEYCKQKSNQCIGIPQTEIKIPNNVFGSLLGSMAGATLSFIAFSELEKIKEKKALKPKIKAYFIPDLDNEEKESYVDFNENHKIYINKKSIFIGEAFWVRVRVENIGPVAAKQCRAYLTKISKYEYEEEDKGSNTFNPDLNYVGGEENFENNGKFNVGKLTKTSQLSNSMPLRWAYERRLEDYFILGSGINFPSNSSYFADVFVIYNPALNKSSDNPNEFKQWFLKLSTKPEAVNHSKVFSIEENGNVLYKFDIEVYADECEKSSLSIILEHFAKSDPSKVRFSCLDESNSIQKKSRDGKTTHHSSNLPNYLEPKIPSELEALDEIRENIYDEI
jgi:hypothetical protein